MEIDAPGGNLATGRSCCQIRICKREITTLLPPGLKRAGGLQHMCVCVWCHVAAAEMLKCHTAQNHASTTDRTISDMLSEKDANM